MKNSEYLIKARDAISVEGSWIKNNYARTATDVPLFSGTFEGACKFCTIGALEYAVGHNETNDTVRYLITTISSLLGKPGNSEAIIIYNDNISTTHTHIMKLFNRAIKAEQEKEANDQNT